MNAKAGVFSILRRARAEAMSGKGCDKPAGAGLHALLNKKELPTPKAADPSWRPLQRRRVAIVIDASIRRLNVLRQATAMVDKLYEAGHLREGQLTSKIFWSMDNCLHSTEWGDSPREVGDGTRRAHCYQGRTRFADALRVCSEEIRTSGLAIDAVIVAGNRCDDNMTELTALARALAAGGTRIFVFNIGRHSVAAERYRALAAAAGGHYQLLLIEQSLAEVLAPVIDFLFRGEAALQALTQSANPDVQRLTSTLLLEQKK